MQFSANHDELHNMIAHFQFCSKKKKIIRQHDMNALSLLKNINVSLVQYTNNKWI